MKFPATIQPNGTLEFDDKEAVEAYLKNKAGEYPNPIDVYIEKRTRSEKQNRMLWGLIYNSIVEEISRETGQDADDIHEFFKVKFLSRWFMVRGEFETITTSTTKLKRDEFSEYVEKVRAFAATEWGITIPETDQKNI